ncbi:lactate dehydrogenase-like 2-hydroxyacid dehydrogenase [Mucilaginibacter sp. UYNi724]
MKAVAYSVLAFEKEYFAKANKKKHDITLIANRLGMDTVHYAEGKEAVIVPEDFIVPDEITRKLCGMGLKYIITRPSSDNLANLEDIAEQMIKGLDMANDDNRLIPVS